jgi:hypothetical protein
LAVLEGKRLLLERHLLALSRRFRVPPGVFRHRVLTPRPTPC